jgi:hypothetical protein
MFEAAEIGRTIPKPEYQARVPILRIELLEIQRQLTASRFPVIVVFAGVGGEFSTALAEGRERTRVATHTLHIRRFQSVFGARFRRCPGTFVAHTHAAIGV